MKTYYTRGYALAVIAVCAFYARHDVLAQGGTTAAGGTGSLTNPLQSQTIPEFLLKIIDVLLVFALPLIVLYIMYAGFLYVTAKGEPGKIEDAKSALLWSVVGGVIVLGARLIIAVIQGTIQAF